MPTQSSKQFHCLSPEYFTYPFFFKYKQSRKGTQFPYLSQHHLCGSTGRWVLMTIPVAAQTEGWRKGRTHFQKGSVTGVSTSGGNSSTPTHNAPDSERDTQSCRLEKPHNTMEPNCSPCPQAPHPRGCEIPQGMRSPPLP